MVIKSNINRLLVLSFGLIIGFSSCKKDAKLDPTTAPPTTLTPPSRAELTKDSIFLYAKDTYYWNEPFPT